MEAGEKGVKAGEMGMKAGEKVQNPSHQRATW